MEYLIVFASWAIGFCIGMLFIGVISEKRKYILERKKTLESLKQLERFLKIINDLSEEEKQRLIEKLVEDGIENYRRMHSEDKEEKKE